MAKRRAENQKFTHADLVAIEKQHEEILARLSEARQALRTQAVDKLVAAAGRAGFFEARPDQQDAMLVRLGGYTSVEPNDVQGTDGSDQEEIFVKIGRNVGGKKRDALAPLSWRGRQNLWAGHVTPAQRRNLEEIFGATRVKTSADLASNTGEGISTNIHSAIKSFEAEAPSMAQSEETVSDSQAKNEVENSTSHTDVADVENVDPLQLLETLNLYVQPSS